MVYYFPGIIFTLTTTRVHPSFKSMQLDIIRLLNQFIKLCTNSLQKKYTYSDLLQCAFTSYFPATNVVLVVLGPLFVHLSCSLCSLLYEAICSYYLSTNRFFPVFARK